MKEPNTFRLIFLALITLATAGCGSVNSKEKYLNTDMYDIAAPKVISLPEALDEISGIAYYPKDTSVFAIIDEDGILFKIPLKDPKSVKQWVFDKPRDYEDLILRDSTFFVLVSNGDIISLKFVGDKIITEKTDFPNASKKSNEFETLYWDEVTQRIVMMCKQCEEDKRKTVTSFFFNDSSKAYDTFGVMQSAPVIQRLGKDKEKIKPSAAAINPVTQDLYILCSVNKLLLITDNKGTLKNVIKLDPKIYKQPEGICFTPAGDMIISNEVYLEGYGQLLILKNKKRN